MKRNFIIFGMMLVLGLSFFGCKNDPPDIWSDITGLDQINGTWKGDCKEVNTYSDSDTTRTTTKYYTMIINSGTLTQAISITSITKVTGSNTLEVLFAYMFISGLTKALYPDNTVCDDANFTFTLTIDGPHHPLLPAKIAYMISTIKINQNALKIIVPAEHLELGSPELVMFKQ